MISLDQVLLLQEKVETAVAKISTLTKTVAKLEAENAALRSKCAELTNALSDKSELILTYESEQNKIEEGILTALSKLDTVENAVLGGANLSGEAAAIQPQTEKIEEAVEKEPEVFEPQEIPDTVEIPVPQSQAVKADPSEATVIQSNEAAVNQQPAVSEEKADSSLNGQFDIF